MTKSTRLGPFNEFLINEIKEMLDRKHFEYKVYVDQDLAKKYQDDISQKAYYKTPKYPTLGEFMFIDVNQESFLLIKKYLYELGVSFGGEGEYLADNELFCTACDFTSTEVAVCPTHGTKMVDYYQSVELKKKAAATDPANAIYRYAFIAFILFAVTVLAKKGFH